MEQGFIDILKQLVKEQGNAALLDTKKCKALLADYTKNEYKKESSRLVEAVEAGVAKAIDGADDLAACKKAKIRELEEEGLSSEFAADIVNALALVLRGDTTVAVSPSIEKAAAEKAAAEAAARAEAEAKARQTAEPIQTPRSSPSGSKFDIIKFGKYDWLVLEMDKQNKKALILSDKVIERREYNDEDIDVTWKSCTLRGYLNRAFYNSFSTEDKRRIKKTRIINSGNPWFSTKGGGDTDDWIFLLSIGEVFKYFGDSGQLRNWIRNLYCIDDQYNTARIAHDVQGNAEGWWLRSPGDYLYHSAVVLQNGILDVRGCHVSDRYTYGGIRPALWLKL
jgi:hypothetical protein